MKPSTTAVLLIGYQNDYFAPDGILHDVIEESAGVNNVLGNTLAFIERLSATEVLMIATPIIFTPSYQELTEAVGILEVIKNVQAFKAGTSGAETIPEFSVYRDRILEIPGKRGLNAFSNTDLDQVLQSHGVTDVVLAGAVTSVCIDSTGRFASEKGYKVSVLSDCTCGRTEVEQQFYCANILPLYANVVDHHQLIEALGV